MRHRGAELFLSVDWIPTETKNYNQYSQSVRLGSLAEDEAYPNPFWEVASTYQARYMSHWRLTIVR